MYRFFASRPPPPPPPPQYLTGFKLFTSTVFKNVLLTFGRFIFIICKPKTIKLYKLKKEINDKNLLGPANVKYS